MSTAKIVGDGRSRVGESPAWSKREQALYWCDLRGQAVHRLDPQTGSQSTTDFDRPVAAPLPLAEDGFAALLSDGLWHAKPWGWSLLSAPPDHDERHRFNDATIDCAGRLIAGTMVERGFESAASGVLYAFGPEGWRRLADGFWTVNGLAFSPDGRTIYVSDSHPSVSTIWRADYDPASGTMGPRQVFARLDPSGGRPDGAAVDAAGFYWIAAIGGGRLLRYAPDGRLSGEVEVPVRFPTKVAFGGRDRRSLYVTSLQPPTGAAPLDGALLQLDVGVAGAVIPPLALPNP